MALGRLFRIFYSKTCKQGNTLPTTTFQIESEISFKRDAAGSTTVHVNRKGIGLIGHNEDEAIGT